MPGTNGQKEAISNRMKRMAWVILKRFEMFFWGRACSKIHSRHLYAPLCGKFASHSVNIVDEVQLFPKASISAKVNIVKSIIKTG